MEPEDKKEEEKKEQNQTKESTKEEKKENEKETEENEKNKIEKETFEVSKENEKKTKQRKRIIIILTIFAVLILVGLFSVIFAILNMGNDKILGKVTINGIDVSNSSKEEALQQFKELEDNMLNTNLTFAYNEFQTTISPKQLDVSYNIEQAIDEAYSIGRDGNIFQNNYEIIKARFFGINIDMQPNYNEEELETQIEDISSKLPNAVEESTYYIEGEELIITKGKEGLTIKKEDMKKDILDRLYHLTVVTENIPIPTETKQPDAINLEAIYQEIHKEPQDAYYTTNPYKLYPHVDGVDFAISMEEAKALLQEEKEEYVIPLKITHPEITTDKLGDGAFPDRLGHFTTKYDASVKARSNNLALAAGKINGTIVMPGETFSYNKVVGERTIAAGYQEAKIYENGKVVDGLGGGICQISSTLYNAVLDANLEIVSRRNHQFLTSYVGAGRDATVVYGSTDFQFKNTRSYPIKLVCSVKSGIAQIDVYGVKEETEYTVEIRTTVTSTIPYTTTYIEDASMAAGKETVKQNGMNGCKSETYKVLLLNGKVVSKTLLSKDTYNPMQRVVIRGTKQEVPATTAPEVPTEPTVQPEEPEAPTEDVNQIETEQRAS